FFPEVLVVQYGLELATGIHADPADKIPGLLIAVLGCLFLIGFVFLLEFAPPALEDESGLSQGERQKRRKDESLVQMMIPVILTLSYASFLDGGLRFHGCLYSSLCYLVGVAVVFIRRGFALTKGDLIWIKWAWLPFIIFGVPLYVSAFNGKWPVSAIRPLIDSING